MIKALKKGLALLLSAILAFCALTMPSYAVSKNGSSDGGEDNTFEKAYEITGSFRAIINVWRTYYKFTPTSDGCYRFSGNPSEAGIAFSAYDSTHKFLGGGSDWTSDDNTGFDACLNFEAGETYYFKIYSNYSDELSDVPVAFDITMTYLGTISDAMLVSPPDKLAYIKGYDYTDHSEPDYIYYEFYLDLTGALTNVTFSGGQTVTLKGRAIEAVFKRSYDSDKHHLGDNNVYYKLGDTVMFSFVIKLIENPVESIEIVRLPDKTDYNFGTNDEQCYDLTGLQVKINYTKLPSKTVNWVECTSDTNSGENDWYYSHYMDVDGYPMYGEYYYDDELGKEVFNIYYLNQTAEFTLNVTIIDNSVESIEIVRLPDKTDYTFGIDGDMYDWDFCPGFDLTGLQVKINYKNNTSKTVDWVEDNENPDYSESDGSWYYSHSMTVDGHTMSGDYYDDDGELELGEVTFYIEYQEQTAEFTLNITPPTFAEKLQIMFSSLASLSVGNFASFVFLPIYIVSELFSQQSSNFESFFNLINTLVKM